MRYWPMSPVEQQRIGNTYWLASYPKSGNTWFRAFLTALIDESGEPININRLAVQVITSSRSMLDDILGFETGDLTHDELDALRGPAYAWNGRDDVARYCKTHDAFKCSSAATSFFTDGVTRRALYLLRNPLDVACSFAHHSGISIDATIAVMADPCHALSDTRHKLVSSARQHLGSWSQHVLGWVDADDIPCMSLRYEDMHADPLASFGAAARFLELSNDARQIDRAVQASSFDVLHAQEMRMGFAERPVGMATFFRRGRANAWREELTDRQAARIIADHAPVMRRFGYLDARGNPT